MIDREQYFNRQHRGSWGTSGRGSVSFTGELGGKQVTVEVSRMELVGEPGTILARRLRMTQISAAYTQTVVVSFPVPVKVDGGGLFLEGSGKDAKGRRYISSVPVDPLLPFRGDSQARKNKKTLGMRIG